MPTGVRRLNRRRYKESVTALKEIIADKKTPPARRLHAIETLLGIFDRHDRTEAQKEARRRAAEAPQSAAQPAGSLQAADAQEESTEEFLERLRKRTEEKNNYD